MLFSRCSVLAAALVLGAQAQLESISKSNTQVCSGMYSKKDWHGKDQPLISVNLVGWDGHKRDLKNINDAPDDIDLSVVIFEYKDIDYLGMPYTFDNDLSTAITTSKKYICDDSAIENKLCSDKSKGKFIISPDAKNHSSNELLTFNLKKFGRYNTTYPIKNTGYYCISTYSSSEKSYQVSVNFKNSFGNLSAAEIPKLPLYGGLTILYLVTFFYYFYNYYKFRKNVTNLQKNLNFFTIFLIVETILIWFYYDLKNNHNPYKTITIDGVKYWKFNSETFIKFYMVFISILNSAKITFSFYLLLLISLGMGVIYPNLPKKTLLKCKIFSIIHFIISIGYVVSNYLTNPENPSGWILFSLVPLSITLTVFYYLILTALTQSTNYLKAQKQTIKLNIYRKLFITIFVSLVVLFLGLVASSFVYLGMSSTDLIEEHWKSRFLILDFWPSLVYYGVYACILFIWRPTYNSYLLIVSSQVGTDEIDDENLAVNNEFELNNLGNEFNINDDDDNDSFVGHFVADEDNENINISKKDEESKLENETIKNSTSASTIDSTSDPFKIEDESDNEGTSKRNPFEDPKEDEDPFKDPKRK